MMWTTVEAAKNEDYDITEDARHLFEESILR